MTFAAASFVVLVISAGFQRISGMGFSLVAMPGLLWIFGPLNAVTLVVLTSALTSLIMVFEIFKEISWKHVLYMSLPSVAVAFPTVYILNQTSETIINLVVGALLVTCTVSLLVNFKINTSNSTLIEIATGAFAGVMNTAAGVAGPAIGAYAFSSRWSYRTFVATAQPYFIMADIGVLAAKYVFNDSSNGGFLDVSILVASITGCFLGLGLGSYASRFISDETGKRVVVCVSAVGALTVSLKGILGLF